MKKVLLTLAVFGIAVPFAMADPAVLGVPNVTCQSPSEWATHDYGAPATGVLVFLPQDGNLEDCGGYDGDTEFAYGGAYLVSVSGDGSTGGGLACYGTLGHHPQGETVTVTDASGLSVAFTVTADATDPLSPVPPGEVDCGDGVVQPCDPTPPGPSTLPQPVGGAVDMVDALLYSSFNGGGTTCTVGDVRKPCLIRCALDFAPGADGAYVVFVGPSLTGSNGEPTGATYGHVCTTECPDTTGSLPPECAEGGGAQPPAAPKCDDMPKAGSYKVRSGKESGKIMKPANPPPLQVQAMAGHATVVQFDENGKIVKVTHVDQGTAANIQWNENAKYARFVWRHGTTDPAFGNYKAQ